jgi:hypothetical protein
VLSLLDTDQTIWEQEPLMQLAQGSRRAGRGAVQRLCHLPLHVSKALFHELEQTLLQEVRDVCLRSVMIRNNREEKPQISTTTGSER